MTGTILESLGSVNPNAPLATSLVLGLVLGYSIAWGFQKLKKSNITVETSSSSLKQQMGTALLSIGEDKRGKVRLLVDNQAIDMIAITQDNSPIQIGEKIIVVSVKDGVANVTRLSHQLQHQKPPQKETE